MGKIDEEKQIVLSLDANIICRLSESGWGSLIPAIASLDGVTIEIPDLISVELCNRLRKPDGSYVELRGGNVDDSIVELLSTAQHLDFVPELKKIADDPDASHKNIIAALKAGNAYREYPESPIVIVQTDIGSNINSEALEYGRLYKQLKEALGGNRETWTEEKIEDYNRVHPYNHLPDLDLLDDMNVIKTMRSNYKSQGELALMERENYAQKDIDARERIVITNDNGRADMLKNIDKDHSVSIANLSALVETLDKNFKQEINEHLPKDHPPFSSEALLKALPPQEIFDSKYKVIDPSVKSNAGDKIIPTVKIIQDNPLDSAFGELKAEIQSPKKAQHFAEEIAPSEEPLQQKNASSKLSDLERYLSLDEIMSFLRIKYVREDRDPCKALWEDLQESGALHGNTLKITGEGDEMRLHGSYIHHLADALSLDFNKIVEYHGLPDVDTHPRTLYTKKTAALEMEMSPRIEIFNEAWDELQQRATTQGNPARLTIHGEEIDVGHFRHTPRDAEMISNPKALYMLICEKMGIEPTNVDEIAGERHNQNYLVQSKETKVVTSSQAIGAGIRR